MMVALQKGLNTRDNGGTMQDRQVSMQNNDEHAISQRIKYLIECLGDLWQYPHELSNEKLEHIIELVTHFPEPYQAMGIAKIAEYLVSKMGLHFLDIMTTFQEKAEQEGIDREEREGTFNDIMPELFPLMMELSRNVSVQSLDDLLSLSNITFGLYRLSRPESAERAQRWMYKLPKLYYSQLAQEHLVTGVHLSFTVMVHSIGVQPIIAGQPRLTMTVHPMTADVVVSQTYLTGTFNSTPPQITDSTTSDSATTLVA